MLFLANLDICGQRQLAGKTVNNFHYITTTLHLGSNNNNINNNKNNNSNLHHCHDILEDNDDDQQEKTFVLHQTHYPEEARLKTQKALHILFQEDHQAQTEVLTSQTKVLLTGNNDPQHVSD